MKIRIKMIRTQCSSVVKNEKVYICDAQTGVVTYSQQMKQKKSIEASAANLRKFFLKKR